ncbi:hypothetical protein BN440_3912 [Erwinia amylovora MR1]|nr:hypothetical protein BN440_3912 [Erwinia amylovora MR1]
MAAGWLPFFSFSLVNSLELTKTGCDLSIAG